MYNIFQLEEFDRTFLKLSGKEQASIEHIKYKLAINPYVGDVLQYPFIREKRIGGKRLYFLIYSEWEAILIVGISDKKTQQNTIDKIVELLPHYKEYVRKLVT